VVKVVAIAGTGRSGSTILDNVLGGVIGAFSAGELRHIWQRGLVEQRLCGCSRPLPECELWPEVLTDAYPGGVDPAKVAAELGVLRTRYTPALLFARRWYRSRLAPLAAELDPLYQAIAARTGARFVVDSSKLPGYVYLLSLLPSVDLRILHLVRDPRAVAFSRGRRKEQLDTALSRPMTTSGPWRSGADWLTWNWAIRRVFAGSAHYMQLRYEDLVSDPTAAVHRILDLADERDAATPHLTGTSVQLTGNHTVSGNPGRFTTGEITLRLDEAWRSEMDATSRKVVEILTSPIRGSFGYE